MRAKGDCDCVVCAKRRAVLAMPYPDVKEVLLCGTCTAAARKWELDHMDEP